jgi:hypothetical protein
MSVDVDTLDEVSRDFITFVSEQRPDWLAHAKSVLDEKSNRYFVVVKFPNKGGAEDQEPLWISTYGAEVTVGLDANHVHFPWPTDYKGGDGRQTATNHIDALMNEERVIVSIWEEGRLRAALWTVPEKLSKYEERPGGSMELRIRSWRGNYNRTLQFDWDSYLKTIRDLGT